MVSHTAQRYIVPIARLLLASTLAFILPLLARAGGTAHVGDSSTAAGYVTTRVSVASDGTEGDAGSYNPVISADGRHVAFDSWTDLLVSGDSNGMRDVFVHDRQTGQTVRVSVASDGTQGDSTSRAPTISADGRYVAFYSHASNLVPNDNNLVADVFVHDRDADGNGTFDEPGGVSTTRVSVNNLGQEGNGRCDDDVSISADGRYVAFASEASNLGLSPDTNNKRDVFVHDRLAQTTMLVSLPDQGLSGKSNGHSGHASISPDGRYVGFKSGASNLVSEGGNSYNQVYLRDLQNGRTYLVSKSFDGGLANDNATRPSVSTNGRYISFGSGADNLVLGDSTSSLYDVFVRDMQIGQTLRVSETADGIEVTGISAYSEITPDGRYIVFMSEAETLISGDSNGVDDVFVRDRDTDEDGVFDEPGEISVTRVSVHSNGTQGSGDSRIADITDDGSTVAFESTASNLIDGDSNSSSDIFVNGPSLLPALSLTKQGDDATPVAGGSLTYTIIIENMGQQNATGGVVSDTLPAELNFVGPVTLDPPSAGTPGTAPPTLATDLTVATGQRVTLTFPVTVALGTPYDTAIVNTAAVTCTQVPVPATGAVTATVHAPLFIEKTVDDPEPQPGQAITYTIRIQNKGLAATTGGIVSDTLPTGLNFVGPITLDPPGAGTPGTTPPMLASGLTLSPGDIVTITLPVTISQDLDYGTVIKNTAAVTSTQVPTPQKGSVTITLMAKVYLPLVLRNY